MLRATSLSLIGLLTIACVSYEVPYRSRDLSEIRVCDLPPFSAIVLPPVLDLYDPTTVLPKTQSERFTERLIRDLRATDLFASVEAASAASTEPDAISIRPVYIERNCFSEPLFTVVTVGIIPNFSCANAGYKLLIDSPRFYDLTVVDTTENISAIWGWVSGPLNLLPGRSAKIPSELEVSVLREELLQAIKGALVGESPPFSIEFQLEQSRIHRRTARLPTSG